MQTIPWALITVPVPSNPNYRFSGFRFAVPESIQYFALTPAHTLPGSLGFAGDLLVSFSAFKLYYLEYIRSVWTLSSRRDNISV